jgi:hypothetical protein
MNVGNGGASWGSLAAGPYYGIYPLGERMSELTEMPERYLSLPAMIKPGMTDEEWKSLAAPLYNPEISDEDYDAELGKIYAGVLPIGSQGCCLIHALVITGEYSGRVIYTEPCENKPFVCFENNFLDWYERWLDEIISGILLDEKACRFGYSREN